MYHFRPIFIVFKAYFLTSQKKQKNFYIHLILWDSTAFSVEDFISIHQNKGLYLSYSSYSTDHWNGYVDLGVT